MNLMKNLTYEGVPVTYNFFPGEEPFIFYGEFILSNRTDVDTEVLIDKAELLTDHSQKNISTFYAHLEGNLVEKKIIIPANSINHIKITFPFIAAADLRFSNVRIRSEISSQLIKLVADSELLIFYETKKK